MIEREGIGARSVRFPHRFCVCPTHSSGKRQQHTWPWVRIPHFLERVGQTQKQCGNRTDLAPIPSLSIIIVTKKRKIVKSGRSSVVLRILPVLHEFPILYVHTLSFHSFYVFFSSHIIVRTQRDVVQWCLCLRSCNKFYLERGGVIDYAIKVHTLTRTHVHLFVPNIQFVTRSISFSLDNACSRSSPSLPLP